MPRLGNIHTSSLIIKVRCSLKEKLKEGNYLSFFPRREKGF